MTPSPSSRATTGGEQAVPTTSRIRPGGRRECDTAERAARAIWPPIAANSAWQGHVRHGEAIRGLAVAAIGTQARRRRGRVGLGGGLG
jgi:hypothetical protein